MPVDDAGPLPGPERFRAAREDAERRGGEVFHQPVDRSIAVDVAAEGDVPTESFLVAVAVRSPGDVLRERDVPDRNENADDEGARSAASRARGLHEPLLLPPRTGGSRLHRGAK